MMNAAWLLAAGILIGIAIMIPVSIYLIVRNDQIEEFLNEYDSRIRILLPYILVILSIPVANMVLRNLFEWMFSDAGVEITKGIYEFEGYVVSFLQQFATPALTTFMTFVYLFLYVFIVVLPIFVYLFDSDKIHLKQLTLAFAINYSIGLISYLVFIAYGPRVFIEHSVEALMYQAYPFVWELTSIVNTPSNVFPSLHTSMSVTVALFSLSTIKKYPRLPMIVVTSAILVIISTMYLGIHWFTDVLAGTLLGVFSYYLSRNHQKIRKIDYAQIPLIPFRSLARLRRTQSQSK